MANRNEQVRSAYDIHASWGPGRVINTIIDMTSDDLRRLGRETADLVDKAERKATSWSGSIPRDSHEAIEVWTAQTVLELNRQTPTITPTGVHLEKMLEVQKPS